MDMEKFYYETPSIKRKNDVIEYIKEFQEDNMHINGSNGLDKFINDYEGWLKKLNSDFTAEPDEKRVPSRTCFLIIEYDNKIIGMSNIRLALNEKFKKHGFNIGYSIRPSERGKKYNNINLYLTLIVCEKYGLNEVHLDANLNNPASWKTMEALGGIKITQYYNPEYKTEMVEYKIDVCKSLIKYKEIYDLMIDKEKNALIFNYKGDIS